LSVLSVCGVEVRLSMLSVCGVEVRLHTC
jgi:hypothetical protein